MPGNPLLGRASVFSGKGKTEILSVGAIYPIMSLLLVVLFGLIITRIAAAILVFTGVSKDLARFQARSAFTNCGFTSVESEQVINHPVRRRVILGLMLCGNAGIVSTMASVLSIVNRTAENPVIEFVYALFIVALGLLLLWLVSRSPMIDSAIMTATGWALKRFTKLDVVDYQGLLRLSEGYTVIEFGITPEHWLCGKNLIELRLGDEGIQVLGIHRASGDFVGAPTGATYIRRGDRVLIYGRSAQIEELEHRDKGQTGDQSHEKWCEEHTRKVQQELAKSRRSPRNGETSAPSAAAPEKPDTAPATTA
ncbi:MAG: TrkA C-terminal domain-containing protein [Candidatus Hydrogenedentes bacterium]|nr:TrkA C-terminal domain-containing protein [Candidatus Hydrogenedentota bacterium]